jgi:hypothetical protein
MCPVEPDPTTNDFTDPGSSECHKACYISCYSNKILGSER